MDRLTLHVSSASVKAINALSLVFALLALICVAAPSYAQKRQAKQTSPVFAYAITEKGTLYGYKVTENGEFARLPDVTVSTKTERLQVAAHPSGKYLYVAQRFDARYDGYGMDSPKQQRTRKTTDLYVYQVASDGALTFAKTLIVDALITAILPHPKGKFVHCLGVDGDVHVFRVDAARGLVEAGKTKIPGHFELSFDAGPFAAAAITFAPGGGYAYVYWGTGFVDHHENYLQRFRVLANGALKADGPLWESHSGGVLFRGKSVHENARNASPDHPGPVVLTPDGKTAFVFGLTGRLWVYRVGPSGTLTPRPQRTIPASDFGDPGINGNAFPVEVADPKGRYIITGYEGYSGTEQHIVYRIGPTSGAAIKRVQTLGDPSNVFFPEPTGRFLYALTREALRVAPPGGVSEPDKPSALSIWKVDNGPRFTVVARSREVFPEPVLSLVFVAPPQRGR